MLQNHQNEHKFPTQVSRKSKSKITTEHENPLSVANPFADINLEGLPEGSTNKNESATEKDESSGGGSSKGRVDVRPEKSGRGGKTVTVLGGFSEEISTDTLGKLVFDLKKQFACGGSLKGRTIELQGDLCERVIYELKEMGFRPVRSGG